MRLNRRNGPHEFVLESIDTTHCKIINRGNYIVVNACIEEVD